MSETKWTPGPWKAVDRSDFLVRANDAKWEIDPQLGGECFWVAVAIKEEDARLIAAAPTMADYIRTRAEAGDEEAAAIWSQINANT